MIVTEMGATTHPTIPLSHLVERDGQPAKFRLLQQVRHAIRTRGYSARTEKAYVGWIRRFILFHSRRHPITMGDAEIREFITHLRIEDARSSCRASRCRAPGGAIDQIPERRPRALLAVCISGAARLQRGNNRYPAPPSLSPDRPSARRCDGCSRGATHQASDMSLAKAFLRDPLT